ncbi:MAG: YncE family protein [Solirubrobacterales bacterium]
MISAAAARARLLGLAIAAAMLALLAAALFAPAPAGAATLYLTKNTGNAVDQFHLGPGGGLEALSPSTIGAGQRPTGIAVSADGKSAYVINEASNSISQYDVGASGLLSAKSPFSYSLSPLLAGGQPGIVVAPNGANLYAAGAQEAPLVPGVLQMALDGSGQAQLLAPPLRAVQDPVEIAAHPTLPKLYVSSKSGQEIKVLTIGAEGKLASASSPPTSISPAGIAITPDGRFLYAAGAGSSSVAGFSIDQTTGALTEIAGSPWEFTEGNAQDVAATNANVYVTLQGTKGIVEMLDLSPVSGALAKKTPESVASKANPSQIVVAPDGGSVYVATATSIDQYDRAAGGLLSAKTPASITTSGASFPSLAITAAGTGEPETPAGPVPPPPPPAPPKPPPPPKIVTEYVAYQHKLGEVLVMRVTRADGKVIKTEIEIAKCYPPPEVKTKCAGLVEVKTRKAGNLVIIDEDARRGAKSVLLAKGSFSVPAGKSGRVVLRPTAAGRKALKGKTLTAWLITRLNNGPTKIAGQQKIKFRLK